MGDIIPPSDILTTDTLTLRHFDKEGRELICAPTAEQYRRGQDRRDQVVFVGFPELGGGSGWGDD